MGASHAHYMISATKMRETIWPRRTISRTFPTKYSLSTPSSIGPAVKCGNSLGCFTYPIATSMIRVIMVKCFTTFWSCYCAWWSKLIFLLFLAFIILFCGGNSWWGYLMNIISFQLFPSSGNRAPILWKLFTAAVYTSCQTKLNSLQDYPFLCIYMWNEAYYNLQICALIHNWRNCVAP